MYSEMGLMSSHATNRSAFSTEFEKYMVDKRNALSRRTFPQPAILVSFILRILHLLIHSEVKTSIILSIF